MDFTTRKAAILAKIKEVVSTGNLKFGMTLQLDDIRFDLRGRAAGMACYRGGQYYMRFNRDMLTRDAFDHVLNNTVPHELAHLYCFQNPRLGSNHDSGWARVCTDLGGSKDRCHTEEVVHGKGYTYEYHTDRGNKVRVGDKYHAMVQRGVPLRYKKGLGTVTKECAYSIVGHQGRTLATPIVKKAHVPTAVGVSSPALTKLVPVQNIIGVPPVPTTLPTRTVVPATLAAGASKASVSRSIMLAGHGQGKSYEEIIAAMVAACGYDRQLARATYKANAAKIGVPMPA